MKGIVFYIICFFMFFAASAQKIENVRFTQKGKNISVIYDIISTKSNDKFTITLYISEDNGISWNGPLKSVSGDVGNNQTPGSKKNIIWDVLADRKELIGEVMFEVRAEMVFLQKDVAGTYKDIRDGKIYKTVVMGDQTWMAENLNYNNGDSWCYDDNNSNCIKFGRLYSWAASKTVCPNGWRLPTRDELECLKAYPYEQLVHTGKSGFGVLLGGWRNYNGNFNNIDAYANFWSSSKSGKKTSDGTDDETAWYLYISGSSKTAEVYTSRYTCGFSIRCIQDK